MPWPVACRLEGMGCTKMINDLDARIAASKVLVFPAKAQKARRRTQLASRGLWHLTWHPRVSDV